MKNTTSSIALTVARTLTYFLKQAVDEKVNLMLSTSVPFTPPSSTVICHLAQENRKIDKDRCPLTDTQKIG
jgi:hypothetical protein